VKVDPVRDGNVLPEVFSRYGWSPQRVGMSHGVIKVDTGNGVYALKKTEASPERLKFLYRVLEDVKRAGFEHIVSWELTRSGEPYVSTSEGTWYAAPWYGKRVKKGADLPVEELLGQLARLHRLSQPAVEGMEDFRVQADEVLLNEWKNKKEQLNEFRNTVEEREFPSPLDKVFKEQAALLDKAFGFAIQGMERFVETDKGRPPRYTLVHSRVHPQNLRTGEDGWKWFDFDHAQLDSPVRDIASFFRRMLPPGKGEEEDLASLLSIYEEEMKLTGKEKKLLALYLAYPERPYHLLKKYYEEPKVLAESAAVHRLEEETDRLQLFQSWVRQLWKRNPGKSTGSRESITVSEKKAPAKKR
jgi:spore coat protein YsxE